MTDRFDVIIIGMGPGGEVAASQLVRAGKRIAILERS
jgi:pyruvate/2-oxoglutarate dehydrogenase complex dihydrolipoamide dehydrogenase (E3) component